MSARPVRRVMIVGQPGSGKSTLARALGQRTGLPVIHIDQIIWQAGWVERGNDEKTRLCLEAEQGDQWIFEGGHSTTWPSRLSRADLLVWIDRPVAIRLWRAVRRSVSGRGQARPDMADGCPERLRLLPEFLSYIWTTRRSGAAKIAALSRHVSSTCRFVHVRSNREVRNFIANFPSS